MGRFINADNYPSTGQGMLGNNMFAYCNNNPIISVDYNGKTPETVLDFISLGLSIADVASNLTNPWAWLGLLGDAADVAIPFVGGIGEVVKLCGKVDEVSDVVTGAKKASSVVSDSVGSYEIVMKNGTTYVGKGSLSRSITSAVTRSKGKVEEVASITWKKAPNNRQAFIDEYISMCKHGGPNNKSIKNTNSHNAIWSPGRKYYLEDYGQYYEYGGKSW